MFSSKTVLASTVLVAVLSATGLAVAQSAEEYYVDPQGGNDSNDGQSPETAYASLDPLPGGFGRTASYTAYLKRGSTLQVSSLSVPSGATYTAYGEGPRPIIQATGDGFGVVSLQGNATVIGLAVRGDSGTGITIMGSGNLVQDCEVDGANSGLGMGVAVNGEGNKVIGNIVRNLNLSVAGESGGMNTAGGAEAFMVMASNNEIAYNSAYNCRSDNATLGEEGGCLEIVNREAKSTIENVHFHHNYCEDSVGLFEGCSGDFSGEDQIQVNHAIIRNSSVSYNLAVNSKWMFLLQPVNTDFENMVFENNTIVHTAEGPSGAPWQYGANSVGMVVATDDCGGSCDYSVPVDFGLSANGLPEVIVRNNLFVEPTGLQFAQLFNGEVSVHTNNLFVNAEPGGWTVNGTDERQIDDAAAGLTANWRIAGTDSAGYNAGADAPYTQDIDGHPVPCDGVPDIGASEYCTEAEIPTTQEPAGAASADTVGVGPTTEPDGTTTTTEPDGTTTTTEPDGTTTTTEPDGTTTPTTSGGLAAAAPAGEASGCSCRLTGTKIVRGNLPWLALVAAVLSVRRRRRR